MYANLGVSSRFYSIIKDMYSKINLNVQCGKKLSPIFSSKIGVRQGDNLSPTLFNIFINDLPTLFDSNCHPANVNDLKLSALLYADDVVLLSETEAGAQCAMNKLKQWCDTWGLNINVSKTKVMCTKESKVNIIFDKTAIGQVDSFRYLGLNIDCSASFFI